MIRTPYMDAYNALLAAKETPAAPDTVHYLAIEQGIDYKPRLKLVCTAAPGAECRQRPADDRESWAADDPDISWVDGPCWAVEWAEDGGWETVQCEEGEEFPRIPITVTYDEGPVIHPVAPHPVLAIVRSEAAIKAEALRAMAAGIKASQYGMPLPVEQVIGILTGEARRIEAEARS